MKRIKIFLHVVGLSLLMSTGCTTMSVTKLETGSADNNEERAEKGGLVLGVHPMTEQTEIKQTFRVNLLKNGVLPIRLTAENRNPTSSFIIAREKVVIMEQANGATSFSPDGQVAREVATVSRGQAVGAAAMIGSPLFLLISALTASESINRNYEHNLTGKEFFTRTLGPGQRAAGFIYFKFPKNTPPSGAYNFVAQIKNSSTGEITPFSLKVNVNLNKP